MIKLLGLVSPVIVPLIVSGLLIFSSEKKNRPKLFLTVYMLIITFIFLANYYYFEHNYKVYIYLHSLHIATVLAIYPGAYIYLKLLTDPAVSRKLYLHFLPSLFYFIVSAAIFFPFLTPEERISFLAEYRFNPDFSQTWMRILYYVRMSNILVLFIQVFVYMILIRNVLKRHRNTMADIFSNPEKFQLNWLRVFNIALALSAFVAVFLYAVNPAKLFGDERYLAYPLLLIALILWFLGIMGNNQSMLPENVFNDPIKPDLPNEPKPALAEKLLLYFENKKPYRNPDFKIWDLARELGTNRTYISQLINTEFNKNFAAFVNEYRIREATEILQKSPEIDVLTLAEEVGFGSVSSFSRSFSEHHHLNISAFRKQVNEL